eukprot:530312_1
MEFSAEATTSLQHQIGSGKGSLVQQQNAKFQLTLSSQANRIDQLENVQPFDKDILTVVDCTKGMHYEVSPYFNESICYSSKLNLDSNSIVGLGKKNHSQPNKTGECF